MFCVYAAAVAALFLLVDGAYIKTYQLAGYAISKYAKSVAKFNFSFGGKTPLKFTNRVKRLFFCDFLLKFAMFLLIFAFLHSFWGCFLVVIFLLAISQFLAILSFVAILPIENLIKKRYISAAKKKLSECRCKIIAITGSYGKTSTKNILCKILRQKFSVCASQKSYNTPMGICRTILQDLKPTDQFLILEFGARRVGDIAFLARTFGADFGMLTPISDCHLESFGSVQAIENTKFELCENCDLVVFNGKSGSTKRLFDRFCGRKFLVCERGSYAYATNIKMGPEGSKFTLVVGKNRAVCTTSLLGQSGIDNIVHCAAMACVLGMDFWAVCGAVKSLRGAEHRLQLLNGGFVQVIDDSYNSNFAGFCEALAVLSAFSGRKIVVSPGIVELGKKQYETNRAAAQEVAKVADVFVIMNKTNKKALTDGASGGCEVIFASSRQQQKEILRRVLKVGDVVLFENDLPDNVR